jgi:hypothetical protein
MNALVKKYKNLPRSGRWLVWTLVLVVVYFGVVEPVLTMTASAKAHADALAAGLQRERALTSTDSDQGRTLAAGRLNFGEPYLPEDPANKPEALHKVVDEILQKHDIGNRVKSERHIRISTDEASQLLGPLAATASVERLILDISFEAAPEVVTAILADLEQAKEVAAISRVEIRRQDAGGRGSTAPSNSKIVKATISPEAWVIAGTNPAGGGFR